MQAQSKGARRYDGAALDRLREALPDYLRAAHGVENTARPFRCIHPSHEDRTPSMRLHRDADGVQRVRCFGCGASGDVFDVAGWDAGEARFAAQIERAAAVVGIPMEPTAQTYGQARKRPAKGREMPAPVPMIGEEKPIIWDKALAAHRALFYSPDPRARLALEAVYKRGFSTFAAVAAGFGWCSHPSEVMPGCERHPKIEGGYIVFPFVGLEDGDCRRSRYAVFRPVGGGCEAKECKPHGYPSPIWREHLLSRPGAPVWVVEGIYDAVAVEELRGAQACALCGLGNVGRLLSIAARTPPGARPPLVLALDGDEAGRRATEQLAGELAAMGARFAVAPPWPDGCKGANDVLTMIRKGGGE